MTAIQEKIYCTYITKYNINAEIIKQKKKFENII